MDSCWPCIFERLPWSSAALCALRLVCHRWATVLGDVLKPNKLRWQEAIDNVKEEAWSAFPIGRVRVALAAILHPIRSRDIVDEDGELLTNSAAPRVDLLHQCWRWHLSDGEVLRVLRNAEFQTNDWQLAELVAQQRSIECIAETKCIAQTKDIGFHLQVLCCEYRIPDLTLPYLEQCATIVHNLFDHLTANQHFIDTLLLKRWYHLAHVNAVCEQRICDYVVTFSQEAHIHELVERGHALALVQRHLFYNLIPRDPRALVAFLCSIKPFRLAQFVELHWLTIFEDK